MTKEELVNYWIETSDRDFLTMKNLFKSGDYHWTLFMGHLVVEKLLKAYYVKTIDINPPFMHNLLRLAEKAKLRLSEEEKDFSLLLTTFNIKARYADYKREFYKKCTKEYTEVNIRKIEELRLWIKKELTK
ncbi:MAG: HEPN domain-containing protein [Candidatus Cloacimonadota bacterium]|nr:MAG: HEPN domain-containing protein [Candidatus Cloacimonadota bacterium]